MVNINRVILTGNLTKDPELFTTTNGFAITTLRLAVNTSRKNSQTGEFEDKPNYFDVKVLGKTGENAAKYLTKGRPVAVDGRLEWREWTTQEGQKRQAVEVIVDGFSGNIQFLNSGNGQRQADTAGDDVDAAIAQAAASDDVPF